MLGMMLVQRILGWGEDRLVKTSVLVSRIGQPVQDALLPQMESALELLGGGGLLHEEVCRFGRLDLQIEDRAPALQSDRGQVFRHHRPDL